MNSELYMPSKVINIVAMLFLELLHFTRVEILVARVEPKCELPQPWIPPPERTQSSNTPIFLFTRRLVYSKILYQS